MLPTAFRFFLPPTQPGCQLYFKMQIRAHMSWLKIPSKLHRTLSNFPIMHTKTFRITLLTSPASFLDTQAPCTRRRFHDSHLSSTRNALQREISIHQTPECLHGRQLPGSGPLPLRDSFLISDPMPPASRRHSTYLSPNPTVLYVDRDCASFISLPKGRHPRIVCGVNERVTTSVPKRTLRTVETSALPGGGLVGTRAREKVPPRGLL